MPRSFSRRHFISTSAFGLGAAVLCSGRAVEPFSRVGGARLRLSLAAYSFRQYFKDSDHARERNVSAEKMIDMFQFIDYCGEHGCVGAEVTSYYFPKDPANEYLLKLKRHAFVRGVEISGTAVGNTFTLPAGEKRQAQIRSVKQWIDRAAVLGAPHIRVFAGNSEGQSAEVARKNCIDALSECADYAGDRGVFLGIENHGGIVAEADALLDIVRSVKSHWVGINLDSGNFHSADPYSDFAKCVPYAVNVQMKTEVTPRGQKKQAADLERFVKILQDARYQGYVVLEYEAAEDPYTGVPRALEELRRTFGV